MTEQPPSPPSRSSRSGSAPPSPLRSPRPILITRPGRQSPPRAGPSQPQQQPPEPPVRETGLIAWIESIREDMRKENEKFREKLARENEVWKAGVQRELREEVRRLVVEKFLADNKPSSSSDTSSLHAPEDRPSSRSIPPFPPSEDSPRALSAITPLPGEPIHETHRDESLSPPASVMPPPVITRSQQRQSSEPPSAGPSVAQRPPRHQATGSTRFILPRRPRIGSYYAAIVDTDGDDPDGALLAHMIEIATFRPGFLYSHTGTPDPHRDCCATLYFVTIGNVHDWMHDVNHAYRLDTEEIERLEQNSGELKRKRRFDAYIRICKVEAEDPWEIFERKR